MENAEKALKRREKTVHRVGWIGSLSIHRGMGPFPVMHVDAVHRWKNSVENVENCLLKEKGESSPLNRTKRVNSPGC